MSTLSGKDPNRSCLPSSIKRHTGATAMSVKLSIWDPTGQTGLADYGDERGILKETDVIE